MKFRIEHRQPMGELPACWIVAKVLEGGESYALASFRENGPAIAMLSLMASTVEAELGAAVEFGGWSTNKAVL